MDRDLNQAAIEYANNPRMVQGYYTDRKRYLKVPFAFSLWDGRQGSTPYYFNSLQEYEIISKDVKFEETLTYYFDPEIIESQKPIDEEVERRRKEK